MSGRRLGRPTKTGDELTQREADTLAQVEAAAPDGITSREIAVILGVGVASTNTWLDELRRRSLAHSYMPDGGSNREPRIWIPGPSHVGPVMAPLLCQRLPSIFHAGQACTS